MLRATEHQWELPDEQHGLVGQASKILAEIFTNFDDLKGKCARINQLETEGNTLALMSEVDSPAPD